MTKFLTSFECSSGKKFFDAEQIENIVVHGGIRDIRDLMYIEVHDLCEPTGMLRIPIAKVRARRFLDEVAEYLKAHQTMKRVRVRVQDSGFGFRVGLGGD